MQCHGHIRNRCRIHLHAGKTRMWAGIRPPDVDDLGEEVWSPDGVKVLGSPIRTQAFIQSFTDRRLEEERRWNAIPSVLDLQCAWQLLLQCAPTMSPRVEDCAPFPISQVRSRTRRRVVPDHDIIFGRPSRQPRTDCHSMGYHHASNEVGRTGSALCGTNWTWCVLGMG